MIVMNGGANSNAITEITEDLIIEIFSRLPQKSVSRFLCLSKQWKSIICSQYFTDLFNTTSLSKPHLLILRERQFDHEWKMFSSHQPLRSSPVAASFFRAKISEYHIPENSYFIERSYAFGLIYFPGDGERHGICNPSTGKFAVLPPIKHRYGFLGYDPIGKQFKVLLCKEKRGGDMVFHVMTLGTKNESHMEIKRPVPGGYHIRDHICINGVLYMFYKGFRGKYVIDCFDVKSEEFFKYEYPESPGIVGNIFINFVNFKGKLGLAERFNQNYTTGISAHNFLEITIWVLEDSDKVEWKKHFYRVEGLCLCGITPKAVKNYISVIGVTDSGDIVLAKTLSHKPFYVYFFNPSFSWRLRRVEIEERSDREFYKIHYFMNHRVNFEFDIMKKTTYAETCMYELEKAKTDASTSSSNDN